MLLSPKAQRDGERKVEQIKREERWDTERKLRPQIQTSKVKYSGLMTDSKEYTSRKGSGSPKKGINERGIRLNQTDPHTYQGQRLDRLGSYGGFLAFYDSLLSCGFGSVLILVTVFWLQLCWLTVRSLRKWFLDCVSLKVWGMGNDAVNLGFNSLKLPVLFI